MPTQEHYIRIGLLKDLSQWGQPYIKAEQWLPGVAASLQDGLDPMFLLDNYHMMDYKMECTSA